MARPPVELKSVYLPCSQLSYLDIKRRDASRCLRLGDNVCCLEIRCPARMCECTINMLAAILEPIHRLRCSTLVRDRMQRRPVDSFLLDICQTCLESFKIFDLVFALFISPSEMGLCDHFETDLICNYPCRGTGNYEEECILHCNGRVLYTLYNTRRQ